MRTAIGAYAALAAAGLGLAVASGCTGGRGKKAAGPGHEEASAPATAERPPTVMDPRPINKVTRASGLVIEDVVVGDGPVCLPRSRVLLHYKGMIAPDNRVFDSTEGQEPLEFSLDRVISGWQDGLPGMRAGGTRRLTVPPELGYGSKDMKDDQGNVVIPASSTLVFEIRLVAVK